MNPTDRYIESAGELVLDQNGPKSVLSNRGKSLILLVAGEGFEPSTLTSLLSYPVLNRGNSPLFGGYLEGILPQNLTSNQLI